MMFPKSASRKSILVMTSLLIFASAQQASAEITWKRSAEQAINAARTSQKPILVYVATSWCHYCVKMKHETWSDQHVSDAVSRHFETLAIDGDRDQRTVEQLGVNGFPATLVFTPDGRFIAKRDGFMSPSQTIHWLSSVRR